MIDSKEEIQGCSIHQSSTSLVYPNVINAVVKEITFYVKDANGNKGEAGIIQDQKGIDIFIKAMQKSEQIPGDFKASPPDYEGKFGLKDNKPALSTFQLWLPSEGDGIIVYSPNTSQGYKLPKEQTKEIRNIIESNRIHPAK